MICSNTDHRKRIAHQLQALGIPHLLMATRSGKRAYDPRKPQVNILSVQSRKDLEFRSVIFIGLGQIETSETQAAQNLKLLYFGMQGLRKVSATSPPGDLKLGNAGPGAID